MHGWAAPVIDAVGEFGIRRPRACLSVFYTDSEASRAAGQPSRPDACSARARTTATRPTTWQTRLAQYDAVVPLGRSRTMPLLERVTALVSAGLRRQRRHATR